MQEDYLAKWLNNELSEDERKTFEASEEFASYQRIVEAVSLIQAPDFDVERAYAAIKEKQGVKGPKVVPMHPFRKFLRVAAAIALLALGTYFYMDSLESTVATQYAERKEVRLPDASEVILNADSKISYNDKKWDQKRKVSLDGEAFFKVAKGERFTVSSANGLVTVLGTQFNVENRKDFFEVTCYEGLVSVTFNGIETQLPAGTSFLAINGKVIDSEAPLSMAPAWLNRESSFKSIPLKYVLDEFQRQFNIKVETQNVHLEQLYTGTFSNTDALMALQSISVPSRIKFKLEGNKVLFYAENMP